MNIDHCWYIVRINDKYYHIDPTWAIGATDLSLFMMTGSKKLKSNRVQLENDNSDEWSVSFK